MIKIGKKYKTEEDFEELTSEELELYKTLLNAEMLKLFEDMEHIWQKIGIIDCILRRRKIKK